jgi:hypothetical protein
MSKEKCLFKTNNLRESSKNCIFIIFRLKFDRKQARHVLRYSIRTCSGVKLAYLLLTVARHISVVKKLDLEIKPEWPISLAKEPPYATKLASEHTAHKRETE